MTTNPLSSVAMPYQRNTVTPYAETGAGGWDGTNGGGSVSSSGGILTMQDFYKLLAAQIQYQDADNPMSTADMMAQMVQTQMIQTIEQMNQISVTTYAASMLGKEVTMAELDAQGNYTGENTTGIVEGVTMYGGTPVLYIDNKPYMMAQLVCIGKMPKDPGKPATFDLDLEGLSLENLTPGDTFELEIEGIKVESNKVTDVDATSAKDLAQLFDGKKFVKGKTAYVISANGSKLVFTAENPGTVPKEDQVKKGTIFNVTEKTGTGTIEGTLVDNTTGAFVNGEEPEQDPETLAKFDLNLKGLTLANLSVGDTFELDIDGILVESSQVADVNATTVKDIAKLFDGLEFTKGKTTYIISAKDSRLIFTAAKPGVVPDEDQIKKGTIFSVTDKSGTGIVEGTLVDNTTGEYVNGKDPETEEKNRLFDDREEDDSREDESEDDFDINQGADVVFGG